MNHTALIMMTTYNGEKYLSQQIESIINQTFRDWSLLIRDDGSSDGTKQLLSNYENKDPRITVYQNTKDIHGAYLNFWILIHEARIRFDDYDYYFFSDQDDVWEINKLEVMINQAEKMEKDKPLLLYSDMRVIDQNDEIVYDSLNQVMGIGEMRGYSLFFTHGFLWGCDICVNNRLFTTLPLLPLDHPHIDIMSHDNYMGKYALLNGKISFVDKVLINHRRHGENTTGGYSMRLSMMKVFKRSILQFEDLAKIHARVYNQTLIFLHQINGYYNDKKGVTSNIELAIRVGGFRMVRIMSQYGVKRKQIARTIGIYLIAILKKYKKYIVA